MSKYNVIALVDCNNFFASCEILFKPELKGKPVCVLSNNDGCIIARSNEAKALGIKMGMPYFMAKKQFKNAVYLSGNHARYSEISKRIVNKLYQYTPTVEVYSIDEAFLDLNGIRKIHNCTYEQIVEKIRQEVKEDIGIDVSIGLSYSKTLAKLASEKAKELNKKDPSIGTYKIGYKKIKDELKITPIEDIWGVGHNTAALLRKHYISSAYDFVTQNDAWIKRVMGKVGLDLKHELTGQSVSPVCADETAPKSIQKTASFANFTNDKNYITNALNYHCHRVCKKLRHYNLSAQVISVMLRAKDFYVLNAKTTLEAPTNSEFEFNLKIKELFDEIYNPNVIYRSCGVGAMRLTPQSGCQLSLFNAQRMEKSQKLSCAWDKIEEKFGRAKLHLGLNALN